MTSVTHGVPTAREPALAGQTVVLIGGSAGIGFETARRARAEGADVVLTGRNTDRLEQAALEVGADRIAVFDASDAASVQKFFQDMPAPIDHVMITAGGSALRAIARDGCGPDTRLTMRPRGGGTRGRAQRRRQDEVRRHAAVHGWHGRPAGRARARDRLRRHRACCLRSQPLSRSNSRRCASTSSLPASSTRRCRHRCSETTSRSAAMSCGKRSRSAASSAPQTSPRWPSTS